VETAVSSTEELYAVLGNVVPSVPHNTLILPLYPVGAPPLLVYISFGEKEAGEYTPEFIFLLKDPTIASSQYALPTLPVTPVLTLLKV
jgi:hypothetical protein